jgi:hypothetical protein
MNPVRRPDQPLEKSIPAGREMGAAAVVPSWTEAAAVR